MSIMHKMVSLILSCLFFVMLSSCTGKTTSTPVDMPLTAGNFPVGPTSQLYLDSVVVSRPTAGDNFFLIRTETSLYKYKDTSEIEWQVKYPGYLGMFSPVIADNFIVVPTNIGQFAVISKEDGALKWSDTNLVDFQTGHNIEDISVSENIVVVAKFNSQITSYDINTGKIIWMHDLPERSSAYLVINDGRVFVAAGEFLSAYDLMTGKKIWEIDFDTFVGPMIQNNGKLILALGPPKESDVTAINLSSGQIFWRKHIKSFMSNAYGGIVAYSNSIYLSGNRVVALSSDNGEVLWKSRETTQLGKPIIFADKIYVRDYDSTIYSLDINSGNIVGDLTIGKDSFLNDFDRGPMTLGTLLIVPFGDNRVFIYKP